MRSSTLAGAAAEHVGLLDHCQKGSIDAAARRGLDPDALRRGAMQLAIENRQATWRLLARYPEFVTRLAAP